MLKWLQEGLNQTLACRAELTLGAETDLFNFQSVKYFKIPTEVPDNWVNNVLLIMSVKT